MITKKTFIVLLLLASAVFMLVPLASASVEVIDLASTGGYTAAEIYAVYPNDHSAVASKVVTSVDADPVVYTVTMAKYGSPNGVIQGIIMNSTYHTLAVSNNTYAASALSTSSTDYNFTFTQDVTFTAGQTYYVGVNCTAIVFMDLSNRVIFTTSNTVSSESLRFNSTNWVDENVIKFTLYGETTAVEPTPTPSPTATPYGGDGDATLEYWGDIVATWIFPILLVLVPAVIAAYYLGKIGFIIGLNIGMILGYAALPSIFGLWTVVMLVLVDIGYFFFARG